MVYFMMMAKIVDTKMWLNFGLQRWTKRQLEGLIVTGTMVTFVT